MVLVDKTTPTALKDQNQKTPKKTPQKNPNKTNQQQDKTVCRKQQVSTIWKEK